MRTRSKRFSTALVISAWLYGCIPPVPISSENGHRSGDATFWDLGTVISELEPNNVFDAATIAESADSVRLAGSIESDQDLDVYALGPLDQGVRVRCTITSFEGGGTTVCFYDEQQRLLARASAPDPDQPRTYDLLLPEPVRNLYLLAWSPSGTAPHAYGAELAVLPDGGVLAYHPQTIVLNFGEAHDVEVAGRVYGKIRAFDAASLGGQFAGRTEQIIQMALEQVRADYQGLGVMIFLASDPQIPPGPYTMVYFGSENPDLLGLADGVDPYNARTSESAIVYTDTFTLFSTLKPSESEIAQVLANVASHEIGHLLGLRHTEDNDDLMDVTATARRLMADQWFRRARLHSSVAPLGYQDAPAMLTWAVGGQLVAPPEPPVRQQRLLVSDDFEIPRAMLCGHCAAERE